MHRFPRLALFCAALLLAPPAHAQDEPRHALVVGNADYRLGVLRNPLNDARSMAAVLLESGFETTLVENVTEDEFDTAIDSFLATLPEGAVGLFYYAGHAIQADGRNYLLPVDIEAGSLDQVEASSISASDLLDRLHEKGVGFGIFILDACRENPYAAEAEAGRGLASMEGRTGETLIGFATQAGEVAFDGGGPNSPYTGALVSELDKSGEDILDVFRSVRRSVRIWTDGRQLPFISASVEREFYFRPPAGEPPAQLDLGQLTLEGVRPAVEKLWWGAIEDSRVPQDFHAFLTHFPESDHAEAARSLAETLTAEGTQVRGLELVQFRPDAAPPQAGSIGALATECDATAGDPDDPRRITDGVRWGLVNTRIALRACSAALAEDPTNPRLLHQMGRVLDILDRTDEAEGFYRVAGSMDYSASMSNLAYLYMTGKGRDQDYAEAMRLYHRAADLGNLRGRMGVGNFYERGWSVEKDLDEAVRWYRLAAQDGWPNALDTLGNLYRRGRAEDGTGLDRDIDEAVRLYRIAAELSNTNAMNNLGQLYLKGEAGTPDVKQGIEWLSRAAELGNAYAPYNLGKLYRDGEVVARDDALAVELFQRAIDNGFVGARIALADMYRQGRGVERSSDEAAFNLAIGAISGGPRELKDRDEAKRRLEELDLSEERKAAARARAEEWVRVNG